MKKNASLVLILLLTSVVAGQASSQGSGVVFNSNADDLAQIGGVVEQFRQAIIHKDGKAITNLMLNPNVLFHSLGDQAHVDAARKDNPQFDGIEPSALDGFRRFLATTSGKVEEKLRNTEIRQDGSMGLVTLNYDFLVNDTVTNSGVEHWELYKIDGQWKIVSLIWTSYDASN